VPIRGKSLGEVSREFVDHLNQILHATVTQMPLSLEIKGNLANIRFRRGISAAPAQLQTRYGPMGFYVGQLCDSVVDDQRSHTLRTTSYRYALLPDGHTEPLIRWEFVRAPANDAEYCRHHFQGPLGLGIANREGIQANFNDWHLPTGWVALEDVLRFCIVDLGVPPLHQGWSEILRDSYERFRTEFSGPGQASSL
jgi:hypothetical protein